MRSPFLAVATVLALTIPRVASAVEFRAGAGKNDIKTSPDMWPVDGFTSQHAPPLL